MKTREEIEREFWKEIEEQFGPRVVERCRIPDTPVFVVFNRIIDQLADGHLRFDEYMQMVKGQKRIFVKKYLGDPE